METTKITTETTAAQIYQTGSENFARVDGYRIVFDVTGDHVTFDVLYAGADGEEWSLSADGKGDHRGCSGSVGELLEELEELAEMARAEGDCEALLELKAEVEGLLAHVGAAEVESWADRCTPTPAASSSPPWEPTCGTKGLRSSTRRPSSWWARPTSAKLYPEDLDRPVADLISDDMDATADAELLSHELLRLFPDLDAFCSSEELLSAARQILDYISAAEKGGVR